MLASRLAACSVFCLCLTAVGCGTMSETAKPTAPLQVGSKDTLGTMKNPIVWDSNKQTLGIELTFVGDMVGAGSIFDTFDSAGRSPATFELTASLDEIVADDALDAIVAQAKDKQIVLLNEAHHLPLNRAFAERLAGRLRQNGFEYLAVEALGDNVAQNTRDNVAREGTGYLTREPFFASFLDSALADGWKLVAYDVGGKDLVTQGIERIRERELREATNIIERVLRKNPAARIFVYAGFGHIDKTRPDGDGGFTMMGEHLKRLTNAKTLHIDQITFVPHLNAKLHSTPYNALIKRFAPTGPIVLRRTSDNTYVTSKGSVGAVDMQVVFPQYSFDGLHGRPEWAGSLLHRKAQKLPAEYTAMQGRRVIKVFRENDPLDATPVDAFVVEAGKETPYAMVPPSQAIKMTSTAYPAHLEALEKAMK